MSEFTVTFNRERFIERACALGVQLDRAQATNDPIEMAKHVGAGIIRGHHFLALFPDDVRADVIAAVQAGGESQKP